MRRLGPLLVCALLLGACSSGGSGDGDTSPAPEAGEVPGVASLSVEITQYRADVAPRRIQVKVSQEDGPAVELHGVEVDLPGYAGPLTRDLDSESRPDGAVDLAVPLGELDCATADDGPARVTLLVGPASAPLEVAAGESDGFVERFRADECAQQAVLDVVPLSWGEDWTRRDAADGLVADGVLEVGPVADGHDVVVESVESTTLYTPRATEGTPVVAPLAVAAGESVQLPVTMAPARCDAHAVAEDKQGYLIGVRVSLDGAEPVVVAVQPGEAAHDAIEGMLLDRCGLR